MVRIACVRYNQVPFSALARSLLPLSHTNTSPTNAVYNVRLPCIGLTLYFYVNTANNIVIIHSRPITAVFVVGSRSVLNQNINQNCNIPTTGLWNCAKSKVNSATKGTSISDWDTSRVKDFQGNAFAKRYNYFNGDVSKWDVSSATNMVGMFNMDSNPKSPWNSDLSKWDVSKVTNMQVMFSWAQSFNSDISKWNVGAVRNMKHMFNRAKAFNSDISKWDVSKVTSMDSMFVWAFAFSSDISEWDVSNVVKMTAMFGGRLSEGTMSFNSDISKWDVSKVTIMKAMFVNSNSFNQDLSKWDVGSVFAGGMDSMFENALSFSQTLCGNFKKTKKVSALKMFTGSKGGKFC